MNIRNFKIILLRTDHAYNILMAMVWFVTKTSRKPRNNHSNYMESYHRIQSSFEPDADHRIFGSLNYKPAATAEAVNGG